MSKIIVGSFLYLLLGIFGSFTFGQITKYKLTGHIVEDGNNGLPMATVSLLDSAAKVVASSSSDKNGFFEFYYDTKGNYLLLVSYTSFADFHSSKFILDNKDFGFIRLLHKENQLVGVQVSSKKNLIDMDGGNIVYNVAKSINAQGSNALDVLKRAPGVFVDNDNNISLNGKVGVAILIDGKQTYLSAKEITELLKSMSSSDIKTIEIINSPSAKYDAAGGAGIINIKTSKSLVQGFSGTVTTGLSYGVSLKQNEDISFSYRKNKVNLYGSYNHFIGNYSYLYGSDRIQSGMFFNSFTNDTDKRSKIGSRLGLDYIINKKSTIGFLINGNFLLGGGITNTKTDIGVAQTTKIDKVLDAVNDYYHQQTQRYNFNLNYKYEDSLGRMINVDADYGSFTKGNGNLQSNRYTNGNQVILSNNLYRSLNAISIELKAIKFDFTTNLWKGKLETGAKYSSVEASNDSKFLYVLNDKDSLDDRRSNTFTYKENITSGYVNYNRTIKKWTLQGGLRVEHSSSTGELKYRTISGGTAETIARNYTNLFPFFSLMVKPTKSHSFSISYSKRIDRPAYQNLNPFIYLLDELSYWQGNPFLKPQLSNRVLLQYVYKSATIVGLGYTHTTDYSVEITDTVDVTKIVMIPRNIGVQQNLSLTLTQTVSPFPWWDVTFNGTLFQLHNKIAFDQYRSLDLKQLAGRMSLQQTFKLPNKFTAEVAGFYNSRRLAGANQFAAPTSQVDLGLQRNCMNNKATLRLAIIDIYKGTKGSSVQNVGGLYLKAYSYYETRQIKLNFTYKFASGNAKGPRNRGSALENENGRIK